jgi:hypothetical protein
VLVTNHAAHFALTNQGTTCTLYVRVMAKEGGEHYEVAVPVTRGRSGLLTVGKRGVFYDVEGREFDAVVTQVVRQPVSLWESMTMPFERIGRFISSKIEGMAVAGEKTLDAQLEKGYAQAPVLAPPSAPAPAPAAPAPGTPGAPPPAGVVAGPGGIIAAVGIMFAAIGSSLAFILNQVKSLTLFDVITAAIIIATGVMVPSGLLGWLKLRKRNLALLLEGSGWALNDRLRLTPDLAALITRRPRLPKNATVDRTDVLRAALVLVRQDEEEERRPLGVKVGVTFLILFAVLWQFREPLAREACQRQWMKGRICDSLLSPGASPAVPPAPSEPPRP